MLKGTRDRILKSIVVLFSALFFAVVLMIFTADRLYSASLLAENGRISPAKAAQLIDIALKLDPSNAELYLREYELLNMELEKAGVKARGKIYTRELYVLKRCIDICPSWPAYHIYYALTLEKMTPRPNPVTREMILRQMKQAVELKPSSELYRGIYEKYMRGFQQ